MARMLNSPMMQGLMDNPEMLRSMMLANPQMREVMENNPELAQMLNDPSVRLPAQPRNTEARERACKPSPSASFTSLLTLARFPRPFLTSPALPLLFDGQVLRQSLASARNPAVMREMQRNTDRAMSNIEAHPGGHNMLRRMYQTVQAPLYDIAPSSALGGAADGSGAAAEQQLQQQQQQPSGPNTSALPNPWAAPINPFGR